MLSRFFGKRDKSEDSPAQEAKETRGLEVIEDDPDTAWGMWESSLAAQESAAPPATPPAPPKPMASAPAPAPVVPPKPPMEVDIALPTASAPLEEMTLEQRKNAALEVVEQHHKRIGNTIRTLWGYKECSVYINKLIMAGGDGMGHARVGFNQDAVQAMLALSDLHDAEFGPPDAPTGGLGLSI